MPFEQVKHRLPVHARRFHRRVRHLLLGQPLAQLQKIGRHRAKSPQRALHRAILRIEDPHARHHTVLVHVHAANPSVKRPQPCHATSLLAHRRSPFLWMYPGDRRLVRFSFACSRRQTTRRQSEAPMEVPDHTLCRALTLHSLIDLFSGPPAPSYRTPPSFSSSRGVRQDMKHSVARSFEDLKALHPGPSYVIKFPS